MAAKSTPAAIANELLDRSARDGKPMTPMQLLKLVYISHGWYLATTNQPLFDEVVQAWKYGPVVPSLFHEFKSYGGGRIDRPASTPLPPSDNSEFADLEFAIEVPFLADEDSDAKQLLDWVWENYGHLDGWKLSEMTHKAGTPWSETVKNMKEVNPSTDWVYDTVIPNKLIQTHFQQLWDRRRNAR